jgi:hypothetical protein
MKRTIALLSLFCCAGGFVLPVYADDDVVVKKNSDGTVEVSDAPRKSAPAPTNRPTATGKRSTHKAVSHSSEPPIVNVHYRLYNPVGTRRINGVSVRTNSDGSIETFDEDTPSAKPAHSHAKAHAKHK